MGFFTYTHLIIVAIFVIASIFHGLTGIGVTLIASTALASFYPLQHVLVLTVLPCLLVNLVVFLDGGNLGYYFKKYWLLALTSFIGSYLGAKLVFVIAGQYLTIGLGIMIIGYVVIQLIGIKFGKSLQLPNNTASLIGSGMIAGVLGGATNAMSPLLVMYLLSATEKSENPKVELIKASNLCYVLGKFAQFIVLWQSIKQLPMSEKLMIGIATVVSIGCLYLGFYFRHKISQAAFKKLVLGILLVLGIKALVKGIGI